ncbi:MAG: helix-turn-helix domain-containing protein [Actinomycetota bacterium]|nr:helix-turn-helix domain-containing protein [Actinomycetota bacterium]
MSVDAEVAEAIAQRTAELIAGRAPARLVDAVAVAEQLGVPVTWVRSAVRRDELPHVRLGHYVRFDPVSVEAWWRAELSDGAARGIPGGRANAA